MCVIYVRLYVYVNMCAVVFLYVRVGVGVCVCVSMRACVCVYEVECGCACMHACMHTCARAWCVGGVSVCAGRALFPFSLIPLVFLILEPADGIIHMYS